MPLMTSKCATVGGKWLGPVILDSLGRLWASASYLRDHFRTIPRRTWENWAFKPCPELDKGANSGKIHSVLFPNPDGRGYPWRRVWLLSEVEIAARRRDDEDLRKENPEKQGVWIGNGMFQLTRDADERGLKKDDILFTDVTLLAESKLSKAMPPYWRQHPHPSLDAGVNGGRLRWLQVTKRTRTPGRQSVLVSSPADWQLITSWRRNHEKAIANGSMAGETVGGLIRDLSLNPTKENKRDLNSVLRRFREEVPGAAHRSAGPVNKSRGSMYPAHRYDAVALRRWLNGRTVAAVAADLYANGSLGLSGRTAKRRQRAERFIQFVLTRGRYSARQFNLFVAYPPFGEELQPLAGGVKSSDVHRWARAAGVSRKILWGASQVVGVRHHRGPGNDCRWQLTKPVFITRPASPSATPADKPTASDTPPRLRKKTGRPKGKRNPEVVEREANLIAAWERGEVEDNKAAVGRAYGFDRANASRILKGHNWACKKPAQPGREGV